MRNIYQLFIYLILRQGQLDIKNQLTCNYDDDYYGDKQCFYREEL